MPYYLYIICNVLGSKLLKLLTEALVLSHLNYSLPVWGTSLHTQSLQRLRRMQNKAVRLCRNLYKYDHVSEHYQHLQWLRLDSFMQYCSLSLMLCQFFDGMWCIPLQPPIRLVGITIIILEHALSLLIFLDTI